MKRFRRYGIESFDRLWSVGFKLNGSTQSALWIVARTHETASKRAEGVLRRRYLGDRYFITKVEQHGWVDYL